MSDSLVEEDEMAVSGAEAVGDGVLVLRTSDHDDEYRALAVPCEVQVESVSHAVHPELGPLGGHVVHHVYVRAHELAKKLLPLDANPRRPRRTIQVRRMEETLTHEPAEFVKRNNGLTLLADEISIDGSTCTLKFSSSEGICNGGHTYFAIQKASLSAQNNALVRLEIIEIPSSLEGQDKIDECVSIARARNNNNKLQQQSEANFQGFYDEIKAACPDQSWVVWHEGDADASAGAIHAVHLIRLLYSINPLQYHHELFNKRKIYHNRAALGPGAIHNDFYEAMERRLATGEEPKLAHLRPLVPDLFKILDLVSFNLLHGQFTSGFRRTDMYQKWLFNQKEEQGPIATPRPMRVAGFDPDSGIDLPPTLETMITGFFRSNVWLRMANVDDQVQVTHVGWFMDPEQLWLQAMDDVMSGLARLFGDVRSDPKAFIRAGSAYDGQLLPIGIGRTAPAPWVIWDLKTGKRYEQDEANPAFYLSGNPDWDDILDEPDPERTCIGYS